MLFEGSCMETVWFKCVAVTGTCSGKWNRGSPHFHARPFVSGVEPWVPIREGWWREISGEGERESDWETSCNTQWKFWSLIGHLIYWSYRGDWASDYLRDYLVPVCASLPLPLSLILSCFCYLASCTCLSLTCYCLFLVFTLLPPFTLPNGTIRPAVDYHSFITHQQPIPIH